MSEQFELPRSCGDGLVCRWGRAEDMEELAAFNLRIHSDDPQQPETFLEDWTRDLMSGDHPTTGASDFTVVVDERENGRIVSSMNLISQTWSIGDIPFAVGRPELVGTDTAYRRRGLVRLQFDAIHAKSAARGELMQIITGIPWYYRQFGYEMALNLGGYHRFPFPPGGVTGKEETAPFQLRRVNERDLPLLDTLYDIQCRPSLFHRLRDDASWRFELFTARRETPGACHMWMILSAANEPAGYVEYRQWGQSYHVRELAVLPEINLRAVGLWLLRHLQAQAILANRTREKPITAIQFALGENHPLLTALEMELVKGRTPYAYYVRFPDLPAFIERIAPLLSYRLAQSGMAGYSGGLRLNFFHTQLNLTFESGGVTAITPFTPDHFFDCDAFFPPHTFYQLLCGYRAFAELDYAYADCYALNNDAKLLLEILFPKRPSNVLHLS